MHFTTGEEDREERRGRGQRVAATAAAYLMTVAKSSTRGRRGQHAAYA